MDAHDRYVTDGGASDQNSLFAADALDGEELLERLLEAGVLVSDAETDELRIGDPISERWASAIDRYREMEPTELGARVRILSGVDSVDTHEGENRIRYELRSEDKGTTRTVSRAVAIAEIAALEALEDHVEDDATRFSAVRPLRMFLESCPSCDVGLVETDGDDADAHGEAALDCPQCGCRLFSFGV